MIAAPWVSVVYHPHAVSALIDGTPTLEFPVVAARAGAEPPSSSGGGTGGGGVLGSQEASSGSENGLGAPTPSCAHHTVTLAGGITIEASCFQGSGNLLSATGHLRVNGLDIAAAGQVTLNTATLELRSAGQVEVRAGSVVLYRGVLDWSFSAPQLSIGVPDGATIKGLPISGDLEVSFVPGGVHVVANATVGGGSFSVSGQVDLEATLSAGLKLNGLTLELASDLPVKGLVIKKASISYLAAGDVWQGKVELELPLAVPTLQAELTIANGRISEVAVAASSINKPLGDDGVFLQSLGLKVVFQPLAVTGSIGLSAGPEIDGFEAASLDGSLTARLGDPFVLEAQGDLYLIKRKLADGWIQASFPGGVKFRGEENLSFGPLGLEAGIAGMINAHEFEAQGHANLSATVDGVVLSAAGDALVNNVGLAGCATATINVVVAHPTVTIGGAYRWNGQFSVFNDSCGFGRLKTALAARAAAATNAPIPIAVPAGAKQINLIVHGASGPPDVVLTSGSQTVTVVPNTEGALAGGAYLALADTADGDTDIAIVGLPAGTLDAAAPEGQPPLAGVGSVLPLPSPDVRVQVRPAGGRHFTLTWSANSIPGQTLVFQDSNARGGTHVLSSSRSHGEIRFTALDNGEAGPQRLTVIVDQDGIPREVLAGALFHPPAVVLRAPRVNVRTAGHTASVTWTPVRQAAGYEIVIETSDGRHLFFKTGASERSIRIAAAKQMSARVRAVGAGAEVGPFGSANAERRTRKRRRS